MTTNLVESMNSVFKGICNLLITALVQATYFRIGVLFESRRSKWSSVLQSGQLFSDASMKFIRHDAAKANTHVVKVFDRTKGWNSVVESIDHNEDMLMGQYRVELDRGWCDCGKFQAFRTPCSHINAACSKVRMNPSYLLSDVYKVTSLSNVYKISFSVVVKEYYWPKYQGDIVWPNEVMRRKKKGHPNSTRIRTEMDTVNIIVRLCSSCRQPGHNRTNCPSVRTSTTR